VCLEAVTEYRNIFLTHGRNLVARGMNQQGWWHIPISNLSVTD